MSVNSEESLDAVRPASREYAKALLNEAGKQFSNRFAVVRKRQARPIQKDSQVPQIPTLQVGALTGPDWAYAGPANKENPSDPHEAIFPVCLVGALLSEYPELRAVFEHVYMKDRADDTKRREHNRLITLVAERIGWVNAREEDAALASHRLERMRERKEKMTRYVLKSKARRAAMTQ